MDKTLLDQQKETIKTAILSKITVSPQYREETLEFIDFSLIYAYEALDNENKEIAVHFFRWLHTTLMYDGFNDTDIKTVFTSVVDALSELYGSEVNTFYDDFDYDNEIKKTPTMRSNVPQERFYTYLEYLLSKDKQGASEHIRQLLDQGVTIPEIYMDVIQPALYEIGWLWQTNKISVADEHLATVISQFIMTTLYPDIFSTEKNDKKVLGAALGSELHEIGIRMVMDMFEYSGYQTQYLGANMPIDAFIAYANDFQPDIIALSITLGMHLNTLKQTIQEIRNHKNLAHIKILVGGQPLSMHDNLYKTIGADGYAKDAKEALEVGERLVNKTT